MRIETTVAKLLALKFDVFVFSHFWSDEHLQGRHLADSVQLGFVPCLVLIHACIPHGELKPSGSPLCGGCHALGRAG